jgi:hypothetical protein
VRASTVGGISKENHQVEMSQCLPVQNVKSSLFYRRTFCSFTHSLVLWDDMTLSSWAMDCSVDLL